MGNEQYSRNHDSDPFAVWSANPVNQAHGKLFARFRDALEWKNQSQNLIAGAKWQVFSEVGNAESLKSFSSFPPTKSQGGNGFFFACIHSGAESSDRLPTPSSIAIVCNSNSSFPCAASTKMNRFSGKSKKCLWINNWTRLLICSELTLLRHVGTAVKDIGRLGYACQAREPSP